MFNFCNTKEREKERYKHKINSNVASLIKKSFLKEIHFPKHTSALSGIDQIFLNKSFLNVASNYKGESENECL